ncbi:hypothetical protein ACFQ0D_06795, partial [Micromonospora zhanjiangensis]
PGSDPAGSTDAEPDVPPVPERVRRMMTAYQSGTRRGRDEAARLQNEPGDEPADPAPVTSTVESPAGTVGTDVAPDPTDPAPAGDGPAERDRETGTGGPVRNS